MKLYRYVNGLNVKYVTHSNVKCYLKTLFPSATFSFPTVYITDTIHTIYIGKKLGLPILFTLPQNSFIIFISVITENLLYELNF